MRRTTIPKCLAGLLFLGAGLLQASPITYTFTGTGTGTLGATSFTSASFIVTVQGDTSAIAPFLGGPQLGIIGLASNININAAGPQIFTGTTFMAAGGGVNEVFFGESNMAFPNAPGNLIAISDPGLSGYALASDLTASGTNFQLRQFQNANTGGGPLSFSSMSTVTFQSQLDAMLVVEGGPSSAPVFLISGAPVANVTGTISGQNSQDYYSFTWSGGVFSATASVTGASTGASYLFSEGVGGTCSSGGSQTLNSGDSFTGTIAIPSLAAGFYCIGLDANSPNDPDFSLTFNTPVQGVATPEPSTVVLLSIGLLMIGVNRIAKRSEKA